MFCGMLVNAEVTVESLSEWNIHKHSSSYTKAAYTVYDEARASALDLKCTDSYSAIQFLLNTNMIYGYDQSSAVYF